MTMHGDHHLTDTEDAAFEERDTGDQLAFECPCCEHAHTERPTGQVKRIRSAR